jgi:hypothetical protein
MGTSHATGGWMSLLSDLTRAPDGPLEGRISSRSSDAGHGFSGVLELLNVREDLLIPSQLAPT